MLSLIRNSVQTMVGRLTLFICTVLYLVLILTMFRLDPILGYISLLLGVVWILGPAFLEWCAGCEHEPKWHGQGPAPQMHGKHSIDNYSGSKRGIDLDKALPPLERDVYFVGQRKLRGGS